MATVRTNRAAATQGPSQAGEGTQAFRRGTVLNSRRSSWSHGRGRLFPADRTTFARKYGWERTECVVTKYGIGSDLKTVQDGARGGLGKALRWGFLQWGCGSASSSPDRVAVHACF